MKRYIRLTTALILALLMPLCGIGLNLLHCQHSGKVWVITEGQNLQNLHCKLQQPQVDKEGAIQVGQAPCMALHQFMLDVTATSSINSFHVEGPAPTSLPCWSEWISHCRLQATVLALPRGGGTALPHSLPPRERLAQNCILRI